MAEHRPSQEQQQRDGADDALLARLRAGEDAAFEELVRTHGGRMLAVARRFLRSEEDARDAVQDAYLSAFRGLEKFEGQARLSTWLHRIVVNASLMKLRTRRRKPEESIDDLLPSYLDDGHRIDPVPEWKASAENLVANEQLRQHLHGAIDQLPEGYREVLLMRDVEQLDTQETAELLGVNKNVVKTRLHRARQALRGLIEPSVRELAP